MICPMCNKREADRLYLGISCCKECADILEKDALDFKKWRDGKYPHWIDLTDYCPTAYGFGDNPTEPNWNYECSKCGHHIFTEFTPDQCPNCKTYMKGGKEE